MPGDEHLVAVIGSKNLKEELPGVGRRRCQDGRAEEGREM